MYVTVPIHNQKNQRVIFYFAIGRSLEDHPRSASMVEIIVGNPDNTEIGDRRPIPQFPNFGNGSSVPNFGLLTLLSPLG